MDVSTRVKGFRSSPIRKLAPFAREASARRVKVYHLNIGQPDIKSPKEAIQAIHEYPQDIIAYGDSEGDLGLRNEIARYYADLGCLSIDATDVQVTVGGSEALMFCFMALCDAGDEVLLFEPYYTNYQTFAAMTGLNVIPITSHIEDDFALPPIDEIEAKMTPKTKAILVCSPKNPTGHVYTKEEMHALLELCRKHDCFMVSDEVYREFCYDSDTAPSALSFPSYGDLAICIDSFSKRFSMCGARLGCIVSRNKEFMAQVLKMAQARLCPPVVEQYAAYKALRAFNADTKKEYVQSVKTEYRKRRDCLVENLRKIPGVRCNVPQGAFYLVAQLPVDDAEDFAIFMLRDFSYKGATVMVAPAEGFYETPGIGRNQVRLAYVLNCDDIKRAITCLKEGLKEYNKRRLA